MKISTIIPCYNQAQYLSEAIESALAQTVPVEIIVVNDGSPDNTKEVASKYSVKLINQVNKGLASARNTGIMNATGDYMFFLDADDIMEPTCIEKLQAEAEETNADIIAPEFTTFGLTSDRFQYGDIPTLDMFWTGNRLPYFCAIKREVLLEVGGYQPKMTHGWEDLALWFDLLTRNKTVALVRESLVRYRTKEESMITEANKHSEELWAQIKKDYA